MNGIIAKTTALKFHCVIWVSSSDIVVGACCFDFNLHLFFIFTSWRGHNYWLIFIKFVLCYRVYLTLSTKQLVKSISRPPITLWATFVLDKISWGQNIFPRLTNYVMRCSCHKHLKMFVVPWSMYKMCMFHWPLYIDLGQPGDTFVVAGDWAI